jgi:hypothetical protein
MNVTDNLSGKLRQFLDYITYSSCNKSLIYITTNMLYCVALLHCPLAPHHPALPFS